MANIISLTSVSLSYPVYSVRAQSLRNAIASLAVGGKLLKDGKDIIHVSALKNISLSLAAGDRMGIVGHNGAGKTTLLKVLAGVYEPDTGIVDVRGRISSMIDVQLGLNHDLTGRENILTMGRMRGFMAKEVLAKMPEIIDFSELGSFIDLPMKTYSAGMITRLIFAVATSLDPDILLLDEWISAGDAGFQEKAQQRMSDILSRSRAMVLASHNFSLIRSVCNKLLVLDSGSQVYFGNVESWDIDNNCPA